MNEDCDNCGAPLADSWIDMIYLMSAGRVCGAGCEAQVRDRYGPPITYAHHTVEE